MDYKNFADNLWGFIEKAEKILITSHKKPDDDSISSVLSIYTLIYNKFPIKSLDIAYTGKVGKRWSYFLNSEIIKETNDIANIIDSYDLVIFLDSCQFYMFSNSPEKLKNYKGKTICIDHHPNIPENFDLFLHDTESSSAAYIIYKTFFSEELTIEKRLAELILLGILGDTGNLRFVRPQEKGIWKAMEKLVSENQINIQEFQSHYQYTTLSTFKTLNKLGNSARTLRIKGWPDCFFTYLTREDTKALKINYEKAHNAIRSFLYQYGTSIQNHSWSIALAPRDENSYLIELRSLPGSVNVSHMMQKSGFGGGHVRASGGILRLEGDKVDFEKAYETISDWMKSNRPVLN